MTQQWGWGLYTVWGIYGEKSPITIFAGLGSGGEDGSWLWMVTGTLGGAGGRWHKGKQVTFPYTANGVDKPIVLPSFRIAFHCYPVFIAQHTKSILLHCSVKLSTLL